MHVQYHFVTHPAGSSFDAKRCQKQGWLSSPDYIGQMLDGVGVLP